MEYVRVNLFRMFACGVYILLFLLNLFDIIMFQVKLMLLCPGQLPWTAFKCKVSVPLL